MKLTCLKLVIIGALAFTAGCSKYNDYCQKAADCAGGNDKDVEACVEEAQSDDDVAAAYDCSEQRDKLTECLLDKSSCQTRTTPLGATEKFYAGDCTAERTAYAECESKASTIDL